METNGYLIDCCLMSSKQYFSKLHDKDMYTNNSSYTLKSDTGNGCFNFLKEIES